MSSETDLIARLRALAVHPAARGLNDDVAVLSPPIGRDLVLTHDVLVEGVHYLPDDPPGDVAWKLLAVNLSDLAGKGAEPLGVLMGFTLGGDDQWDRGFIDGLGRALVHFKVPLLGGDTVAANGPRVLGLTAIGQVAAGAAPSRTYARPGDDVWVTGSIGDAGAGLRIATGQAATGQLAGERSLMKRYRLPMPRLALGRAVLPYVHAMMDVSDGLLIDAGRMAKASDVGIRIDLDAVPLSPAYVAALGDDRDSRMAAVTAGDDYELLFTAPPQHCAAIKQLHRDQRIALTCIGKVNDEKGLSLWDKGEMVDLPKVLGWEHDKHK